ncbi:MAG TPA: AGE family epimerase/isomerase [Draconibacterium sp.]|nr:AGE family epimerase/isomerase [Draconibacterium sp.]HRX12254.1 AGE family epimerase/isomerase [Draconibacterium sp.]
MRRQNATIDSNELAQKYKSELLDKVIPFWLNHSKDEEFGGYFTCLDRKGKVFDTDKFIWLQAREVWMFSSLYNNVEQKPEWLEMALHGAEFLKKHAKDADGNWYFSLTREGKPLIQPYNIFSDCFACMAFGQLYKATGNPEHAEIARQTFQNILKKSDNPKGKYNKTYPGTRPLKGFSLPMILCNLSLEIEHLLEPELVKQTIDTVIHEVMEVFYDEVTGLIFENVNPDGSFSNSFEGRLLNPGHAIEAMWFIMDLADRLKNRELMDKSVKILLKTLKFGWDEKYGGIFYFLDVKGFPPQQLEWDQKLWWVHIETLISLIKAYRFTGNEECLQWFEKVHNYTWSHFADAEYAEWFGYLNRQGEVLLSLKGGKWKGCFHVPRGLFQVWKTLEKLEKK